MNTPPPTPHPRISLLLVPLSRKRDSQREMRGRRDDSVLVLSHSFTIVLLVCFRVAAAVVSAVNHEPLSFHWHFSVLDLHVNYLESKSFMCHIHSLQHILMITLCLNFLNYSTTSPFSSPSLWAGKCILPFNCIQN